MSPLRERCKAFLDRQMRNAITRTSSPVDDLVAFVMSEQGRSADARLEGTQALVLFFPTAEDRDEFVELVRAVHPNMVAKDMP